MRAELLAGMRSDEEPATRRLIELITFVAVDQPLAEAAGSLGRRYLRSHQGIEVADLIIAALTQHLGASLKTKNVRHYPMFEDLQAPY